MSGNSKQRRRTKRFRTGPSTWLHRFQDATGKPIDTSAWSFAAVVHRLGDPDAVVARPEVRSVDTRGAVKVTITKAMTWALPRSERVFRLCAACDVGGRRTVFDDVDMVFERGRLVRYG